MANHITPFEAAEGVNRANFNSRIDEMNAALEEAGNGSGINQLDNWYFASGWVVNQRNIAVNTAFSTAGAYFIDRWKLVSGSVTLTTGGLILNGTIRQVRERALRTADFTASVFAASGTATAAYNDSTRCFDITSSGGTVLAAKLELGGKSTLTRASGGGAALNDPIPNVAAELDKCRRYFRRSWISSLTTGNGWAWCIAGSANSTLAVTFDPPMRATPSVTIYNPLTGAAGRISDWAETTSPTAAAAYTSANGFGIGQSSGLVKNTYYFFHYQASADL